MINIKMSIKRINATNFFSFLILFRYFSGYQTLFSLALMLIPILTTNLTFIGVMTIFLLDFHTIMLVYIKPFRFSHGNLIGPWATIVTRFFIFAGVMFYSGELSNAQSMFLIVFIYIVIFGT